MKVHNLIYILHSISKILAKIYDSCILREKKHFLLTLQVIFIDDKSEMSFVYQLLGQEILK